jgi:HTTM domain
VRPTEGGTAPLRRWFFARGDASAAAAIRIAFGALVLFAVWDLYPVMDLLLGHSGCYGTLDPRYLPPRGITTLLYYHDSPAALRVWFMVTVFSAVFTAIGLYTRAAVPVTLLCLLLVQKRNPFMLFGADIVLFDIGLWLLFLRSDRAWSADRWIRKRSGDLRSRVIPLWPLRVIQIQIALIYLRTALAKSGTEPWQDGSAVYYALAALGSDVVPSILDWKLLLSLLTYGSLGIEFCFAILVFWKPTRRFALISALLLHLSIDVLMSIRLFGLVMIAGLSSFILPSEWLRFEEWIASRAVRARSAWMTLGSSHG